MRKGRKMGVKEHRKQSQGALKIGIISMSSTRTVETDESGAWMKKRAQKEGHGVVSHVVIHDNEEEIRRTIRDSIRETSPDVLILTGGTGIGSSDVTIEAVTPMMSKELTSFAPVFAQLSLEQIDSAAIISRSTAGIIYETLVFCLPGSLKACKLACKALIFPEVNHLINHIRE